MRNYALFADGTGSGAPQLQHEFFPLGGEGGELVAEVGGEVGEALGFGGGDVDAELLLGVSDRGFDARNLFFKEGAAVFHLLLPDGIQAVSVSWF